MYNIDDYKLKIEEIQKDLEIFETQKIKEEEKQNSVSMEKETLREELEKLVELIEKTQNLGFEVGQKKEQINSEININQERIVNNEENYKRYEIEIEGLKEKNRILEEDKEKKK